MWRTAQHTRSIAARRRADDTATTTMQRQRGPATRREMAPVPTPTTPQMQKRFATSLLETTPPKQRVTQSMAATISAPVSAPATHAAHLSHAPAAQHSAGHKERDEERSNRHILAMLQQVLSNQVQGQQQVQGITGTLQHHGANLNNFDENLRQLSQKWDGATLSSQEQMHLMDQRMQAIENTGTQEKTSLQQRISKTEDKQFSGSTTARSLTATSGSAGRARDFTLAFGEFPRETCARSSRRSAAGS